MTVNTLGTHEQDRTSRTAAEWLWPLLPIGVSVFFLSSLIYYHVRHDAIEARSALQVAVASVYRIAGFAPAVLCFLLALTWSSIWFATGQLERPVSRVLRLLAMTLMLGVFLNVGDGGLSWHPHKGELGAWFAGHLLAAFGYLPSLVLVWAVTFASLLLATDFFFSESFERLRQRPADAGVEVAVTDHLRGLGQSGVATLPEPGMALATPAKPADPLATTGELAAAAGLAPEPEAAAQDATDASVAEAESRRPTYSERRARRERFEPAAERAFDSVEEEGDAQEIENSAAAAGEAAMAGEKAEPGSGTADESGSATSEVPDEEVPDEEIDEEITDEEVTDDADDDDLFVGGSAAREAVTDGPGVQPGDAGSEEPLVQIPRMDVPPVFREPTAPETRAAEESPERVSGRQQELFAAGIDERLVQDAIELVTTTRRASATLLQRKLRIDYARAVDLLAELAARGLVAHEGDE
ncbi:MAG TPA: DNA translocase FtsK [Planctomycetota bacterium]|nr:DNA translocase FtsK [Planctomycetota bacterium]